jgi:ABC-type Mn2+/Zn2+ transport system permease subunit
MFAPGTRTTAQRIAAVGLLLVSGVLSLPVAAAFLDGEGTENWIIPAQLGGMVLVGAGVGALLPGLAGAQTSTGRSARIGAGLGVVFAIVGVAVFWLLINGLDGA